ncbi:MAG TPA: DUF4249 domain-containing protein [Bacteroidia bacterium]|jgi:hypothetical protein|nr:DUF4249 domain-containing protein [Bacteroidia bacterium]
MKRIYYIMLMGMLAGCSKNVNLDLPTPPTQITVDGHIEPGQLAYMYLSRNIAYTTSLSITSILAQDIIHGAFVTITDGTSTDTMRETNVKAGYYQSTFIKGQIGKTYSIKVSALGQTVTSSTTILQPIPLDSAWFKVYQGMDTLGYVWATLSSPLPVGRCYRWLTERIGKDTVYIPPTYSAFNDALFAGQSVTIFFNRGEIPGSVAVDDTNAESGWFKTGEKVVVKFSVIDNIAYQFYNTYYTQQYTGTNPFASPGIVVGNIKGGNGIWCAYGASYDTVTCK